jgi:hypothetical protein
VVLVLLVTERGIDQLEACVKCSAPIPLWAKDCPVCQTPAGFPNVRVASREAETEGLKQRVESARSSARARGSVAQLEAFEAAVENSHAVMSRRVESLQDWMQAQNPLWYSFHRQVEMGRIPNEDPWDEGRESAEAAINPYTYREMNFAALSLDGAGITSYGPFGLTLRDADIEDRTTVFEENPFFFNKKHHVIAGQTPPKGYRSVWGERARLAIAKLHSKISSGTPSTEFATILMEDRREESDCDFVEVHIYGAVNRQSITRVVGREPAKVPDRLIWKSVRRQLVEQGAEVLVG